MNAEISVLGLGQLGHYLKENLSQPWEQFRAAVAFVKRAGVHHIAERLADFSRTGQVEIIAGIDLGGTSIEGLQDLLDAVSPTGRIVVFHNRRVQHTFHPKIYLFKSPIKDKADLVVGSANLTNGGFFTNYEASLRLSLDLTDPVQKGVLRDVEQRLDSYLYPDKGLTKILDDELLGQLKECGLVLPEVTIASKQEDGRRSVAGSAASKLFNSHAESREPLAPRLARKKKAMKYIWGCPR